MNKHVPWKKSMDHIDRVPTPGHKWTRVPAFMLEMPQHETGRTRREKWNNLIDILYMKSRSFDWDQKEL